MGGATANRGGVLASLLPWTAAGLRTPPPPVAPGRAALTCAWRGSAEALCGPRGTARDWVSAARNRAPGPRAVPHRKTAQDAACSPDARQSEAGLPRDEPAPPLRTELGGGGGGPKVNLTPRSPGAPPWAEPEEKLALRPAPSAGAVPKGTRPCARPLRSPARRPQPCSCLLVFCVVCFFAFNCVLFLIFILYILKFELKDISK